MPKYFDFPFRGDVTNLRTAPKGQEGMAVVKDFMGRVFLVPEDKAPQGETVVYMNFGFNSIGNQVLPMYRDHMFGQYFSEAQYNRVSTRIQQYLDQNGTNACCATVATKLAMSTLCLVSCPMCYIYYKVKAIDSQLQKIIQEECSQWKCDVKLMRNDQCFEVASSSMTMSFDETGRALEHQFSRKANQISKGKEGHQYATYTSPAWPPLGYNIIVTIQGTELRTRWPKSTSAPAIQAAVAAMPPSQITMPVEQPSLASQLSQLADLKAKGSLSEEEYVAAKGKLLG